LLPKRLQKFKNYRRQLGRFIVGAVQHVELQLDRGEPVSHLRVFAGDVELHFAGPSGGGALSVLS
jgi:hypothetical protein